ncbi:MAG TPA: 2-oxo-4-hydroxy-4-carboxy-5-ureidoimidazoline decarboxylase [Chloroflexota bacterium]|nr:2-oxo-4-hydroxy-4-carboxy-5-ureidoimidazoline decarboxylase [Chloroflexota bacterium]
MNGLGRDAFAEALAPLFEAAGPLADALYAARPFDSYSGLIARAEAVAAALLPAQQVEVVNAHPRIGANAQDVSALSYREQGYAAESGQDLTTVYVALDRLNREYEARFGFRFVVFVNKRSKPEILEVLRQRIDASRDAELQTAIAAIFLIARDRLAALETA